jgi:hypothetical protein
VTAFQDVMASGSLRVLGSLRSPGAAGFAGAKDAEGVGRRPARRGMEQIWKDEVCSGTHTRALC